MSWGPPNLGFPPSLTRKRGRGRQRYRQASRLRFAFLSNLGSTGSLPDLVVHLAFVDFLLEKS